MKIGLSLSLCIKDIIEGRVNQRDVAVIVAGTHAETDAQWASLIRSYQADTWQADPAKAAETVYMLRERGQIVQPRANGQTPTSLVLRARNEGHWLDV